MHLCGRSRQVEDVKDGGSGLEISCSKRPCHGKVGPAICWGGSQLTISFARHQFRLAVSARSLVLYRFTPSLRRYPAAERGLDVYDETVR